MVRHAIARLAGPHRAVVALRKIDFIEEALADLVHRDQVLVAAAARLDAGGAAEREGRMSGQHAAVGVAGCQPWRDVEALGDPEILLHARKIGADPHAGDNAAGVLAERAEQRPPARHEGGLVECGIEHAAELRVVAVTAAADEDRHLRTDVDGGAALIDVALVRSALQSRAGVRVEPRRVARLDAQNPSRELLLANELSHAPVEHEPHALFARAEFQTARERGAVPDRARPDEPRRTFHEAWGEVA